MKLQKHDLSYFLDKTFVGVDGSQNMFAYQPTFNTIVLKDKGTNYILNWKSKGIYSFELKLLHAAFLHSMKHSGCRMGIKIDKEPLAVEQNNYVTKIINSL